MLKIVLSAILFFCLVSSVGAQLSRGTAGRFLCGGNHAFRLGGQEITFTSYVIRNFSSASTPLTIDRIIIYDAGGTILRSMPPFPGSFDTTLGAHQTTTINTLEIFGTTPAGAPPLTPIQAAIEWSVPLTSTRGPGVGLVHAYFVRQDRGLNTVTGNLLEQRGRSVVQCVEASFERQPVLQ